MYGKRRNRCGVSGGVTLEAYAGMLNKTMLAEGFPNEVTINADDGIMKVVVHVAGVPLQFAFYVDSVHDIQSSLVFIIDGLRIKEDALITGKANHELVHGLLPGEEEVEEADDDDVWRDDDTWQEPN